MTWKAIQCALKDSSPSRALGMAKMWHFPEDYFSIRLQVWNWRRVNTIKSCCPLNLSALAFMFVALICPKRCSKFPAFCMGRVGFISAWPGSEQHALALLLWRRRNGSVLAVQGSMSSGPWDMSEPASRHGRGQITPSAAPWQSYRWAQPCGDGASQQLGLEQLVRTFCRGLQRFSRVSLPVVCSCVTIVI